METHSGCIRKNTFTHKDFWQSIAQSVSQGKLELIFVNVIEKILLDHSVDSSLKEVSAGDIVNVSVDKAILLDIAGQHPELLANPPNRIFDPDKFAVIFDHFVPSPNVEMAVGTSKLRELVRRLNVRNFYDYGNGGISHAFAAEMGWFLPGHIIANTDSHSIAAGGYQALSRGLGTPELMQVMCTGTTWFSVGETARANLTGKMRPGTEAKDVFFHLAGLAGELPNMNLEFSGEGIQHLSVNQRAAISTMCAELSLEFAVFPYDEILHRYLEGRAKAEYRPYTADPGESYKSEFSVEMSEVPPMAALPGGVSRNTKPVAELQTEHVDQCTIGSCANGRIEDLEAAARILKGRKVHQGTRLIVTPATKSIYLEALDRGYIRTIIEAGGIVTNPTCGSCMGGHMGLLADGEVAVSSTTRNFKGRMGSRDARIYLASSSTVAATAINGYLTDPTTISRGA